MDKILAALYKKDEWKEFRLRILEHDNYRCTKCGASYKDMPCRLHVHHKKYYRNTKPWEYDLEDVTTYCCLCHLEEHDLLEFPRFGWEYLGFEDLGEMIGECEYPGCEHKLRYQHTVYHPKIGELNVGAIHADRLLDNTEASELEKTEIRKADFCNKFKQINPNEYSASLMKYSIVITKDEDKYYTTVGTFRYEDPFETLKKAQCFSFDIINRGMIENLIKDQHEEMFKSFVSMTIWSDFETKNSLYSNYLDHGFGILRHIHYHRSYDYYGELATEKKSESFEVNIDNFTFDSFNTLQEAQIFLFDLLYDPHKYTKIFKKVKKSFLNSITNYHHWYHPKNSYYITYSTGKYTFLIKDKHREPKTLYVIHKDYAFRNKKLGLDTKLSDDYYVKLDNYSNFLEAANAAYNYMMEQNKLLTKIQNDPNVQFSSKEFWESTTDSNGFVILSYILNGITIKIKENNNKFQMSIGQLEGKKEFSTFEEVQKIAYQFITSGEYAKKVNS